MMCYFHPQAEGVSTCAKCGIAMCRECESNAFFRTVNGTGQAFCNRCSYNQAKENVDFCKSWLIKKSIMLVICTILIAIGAFFAYIALQDAEVAFVFVAILWAIAGFIMSRGQINPGSVKSQVKEALDEHVSPFLMSLVKIIVYAVFAPILLICSFIGYTRTKFDYKQLLKK